MSPHRGRRDRSAGALGVLRVVAAVAAAVLLPAPPAAADFTRQRLFSSERRQHDDWEPSVAADDRGNVYIATTRYNGRKACPTCPDPAIVIERSTDGGRTWSGPRFLCRCPGVGGQHDPVLTTDASGRLFATWMNDFEVTFARSDDFGETWTRRGALDGPRRYSDKPWIGVSDSGNDVYVTFNADGPADGAPYTVYSHNAGRTTAGTLGRWRAGCPRPGGAPWTASSP